MSSLCASALQSLDDCLALLCESLGKLKAAKSVDMAAVIEQLKVAAESARIVRESLSSELPEASWQNREELDALIERIQQSLDARTLEQLRSRLLALASELERGRIVHRRAHRVSELNQLRHRAINELRSQAGLEGAPQTLPGPQADQWIEWACGLKEPQDAESLQTLRHGFVHLDDFVSNLEPNMWIPAESPTSETLREPGSPSDKTQEEQSRPETNGFEEKPQFPGVLDERSLPALESNTPTPNDVPPPQTEEEIQRMLARERALLDNMMGLDGGPLHQFTTGVEQPRVGKWRIPLATAAVLVLALAALGAIQWRSHRNQADFHPPLPQVTPTYTPVKSPTPVVPELVQIKYFNVEPKVVEPGQRLTLSWEVMHAKEVWIKGLGPQPILVRPSGIQTFPVPRSAPEVVLEAEGEGANNSAIEVRPINFARQAEHR